MRMVLVCGIDEAGRGPVIGPLVICGAMVEDGKLDELRALGVKDSKMLTHKSRTEMCAKIKEVLVDFKIIKVQPSEIDHVVESKTTNLNWLEADKSVEIINALDPDEVILDCPSPNVKKYASYIKERVDDDNVKVVAKHKADRDYVIVGAASILAKCEREHEVAEIEKVVGQSIGSGYPSNPVCQEFLRKHGEQYPEIIRRSWMTWKNHVKGKRQKTLGEF